MLLISEVAAVGVASGTAVLVALLAAVLWLLVERKRLSNHVLRLEEQLVVLRENNERTARGKHWVSVETYEASGRFVDGYIARSAKLTIKQRLLVDGLPIGQPWVYRTVRLKRVDKPKVDKLLDDYAKPLLELGIDELKKLSGPPSV